MRNSALLYKYLILKSSFYDETNFIRQTYTYILYNNLYLNIYYYYIYIYLFWFELRIIYSNSLYKTYIYIYILQLIFKFNNFYVKNLGNFYKTFDMQSVSVWVLSYIKLNVCGLTKTKFFIKIEQLFLYKQLKKKRLNSIINTPFMKKAYDQCVSKRIKILKFNYFVIIKPTLNNFFVYCYKINLLKIFNVYKFMSVKLFSLNIGHTGYRGPAKISNIAVEKLGELFALKLFNKKLTNINLILLSAYNFKIQTFLQSIKSTNIKLFKKYFIFDRHFDFNKYMMNLYKDNYLLKIMQRFRFFFNRMYVLPKIAHNGSRLRKPKRL